MFVDPYTSDQVSSGTEWASGYAAGQAQAGFHHREYYPPTQYEYQYRYSPRHYQILDAEKKARAEGFKLGQKEGTAAAHAEGKSRHETWKSLIEENEKVIAQLERDTQAAEAELEQSRRLAKKAEAKLDARKRQYEERIQRLEQTLLDLQKQMGVSG